MNIVFRVNRNVEIENVAHIGNVETARGNIGSHQQLQFAFLEVRQHGHARALIHIAMQGTSVELVPRQRAEQFGYVFLAITEDDRVLERIAFRTDEIAQNRALVPILLAGFHQALGHGFGRRRSLCNFNARWRMQELFGQLGDFRRHGGREEQGLTRKRNELADAFDVRNEAHIEHTVCFIDDENFNTGQEQLATLEMIEQATGCRDENIGTAFQLTLLFIERHAANQKGHVQPMIDAVFGEVLLDLRCEFAGRLQNERTRHARPRPTLFQKREHRKHERRGLSGSRLRDTENILAFKGWRNGSCLNGCGRRISRRFYSSEHFRGKTEFGKCRQWRRSSLGLEMISTHPVIAAASSGAGTKAE